MYEKQNMSIPYGKKIIYWVMISSLLISIAWCGQSTKVSDTLNQCYTMCDQKTSSYGIQAQEQCHASCKQIDAINQQNNPTPDIQEKITNNADCKQVCTSALFANATADEQKKCIVSCQTSVKIASADLNDCNDIDTISDHTITKDACIMSKATTQKQAEYCQNIQDSNMVSACYTTIAHDTKNPELCTNIPNETEKTVCTTTANQ